MQYDTVTRETVDAMVREFYSIVIKDQIVGPYFIRKLGDNLDQPKWIEHITILDNFWLLMMNGERGYPGDPFPSHAFIGKLYVETFERWLELFHEVVYRMFIPEIAEKFYKKAEVLAEIFIENLGLNDEDDD